MKIIYYSPHPNLNLSAPSGPGTHMREVIAAFERKGHTVVPLIMGGTEMDQSTQIDFTQSLIKKLLRKVLPESLWQSFKDWRLRRFDRKHAEKHLEAIVQQESPDLIYERGYYLMTSGVKVAKRRSIPHTIELNAPYPEEKMAMEGLSFFINKANTCEGEQVSMTNRVVVVSSALKEYLSDRYPKHAEKIIVTPNAVNPDKLKIDPERVAGVRQELGYTADTICLGFVGSIFPYHGVKELLNAFVKMHGNAPYLRLLIVGDGEILNDLKQISADHQLSEVVHFTGNVAHKDVPNYIAQMDVTIMPRSNWYGSPVKIFEYGLLEKAIIAPDNVPVRDVMVHEQDGLLVGEDEEDLKNAIRRFVDEPELRKQTAKHFHEKVLRHYNWDTVAEKILA
ncbi:MAG: glycosyltransferase family 4 protein [Flavobacteriales bacterium]|nr:glycosyltransferase family 4 protein [Flavobacteriales bacterium]